MNIILWLTGEASSWPPANQPTYLLPKISVWVRYTRQQLVSCQEVYTHIKHSEYDTNKVCNGATVLHGSNYSKFAWLAVGLQSITVQKMSHFLEKLKVMCLSLGMVLKWDPVCRKKHYMLLWAVPFPSVIEELACSSQIWPLMTFLSQVHKVTHGHARLCTVQRI